ncbi:NUDIX domain-containing protein [Arcticibacter sp. MXS-1]|uniref:NUDIX domain-containing protein n=1 Tax=Arcticibacter sp. MXS-1 TaxID=3341726 RepID=UPI0035A8681C
MFLFNVRVYGLLINEKEEILLSDEEHEGVYLTKFPGGGLEYGEGLIDALKREFLEECNLMVEVTEHLYTTDFFEKSAFNESQIISIYYLVRPVSELQIHFSELPFSFEEGSKFRQAFRWKKVSQLQASDVTFLTEKKAIEKLKQKWQYRD